MPPLLRSLVVSMSLAALAACVEPEPAPELGVDVAALAPPSGQGAGLQGAGLQGAGLQGATYASTSVQGARWGGYGLSSVVVDGGQLVAWRLAGLQWEQRLADRVCMWDLTRTVRLSCTVVTLAVSPSPLAGITFDASFRAADGTWFPGKMRIGSSTAAVGAVARDTQVAMHPLDRHASAAGCPLVACENPNGCRSNCDLWLFQLELPDVLDAGGEPVPFCPVGERAVAVRGTYDATGAYTPETPATLTFACTNGTIAKCTRWGYRPFGVARPRCASASCSTDPDNPTNDPVALVDYHRACVRAASADYCANGHSFTRDGTLVDIYDFVPKASSWGLIPSSRSQVSPSTAFVWESSFDRYGAHQIDHLRYQELAGTGNYGDIDDPEVGCPGRFVRGGSSDVESTWMRQTDEPWSQPTVMIDSTTTCAHSELTVGKWLDPQCTACTHGAPAHCTDPTDPSGWDRACVEYAKTCSARMTSHGECETGAALPRYATGCTLRVCLDDPRCCGAHGGSWTDRCVSAAKNLCRGGQEGRLSTFCGSVLSPLPGPISATTR